MEYRYRPNGVCSSELIFNIDENNIVQDLKVIGGCNGNLKGISALIKGMNIDDVIQKLSGILCGYRNTSYQEQISKALAEFKNKNAGIIR